VANTVATALSTAIVTGAAAVVGVLVAREFGRDEATDGFFAAYGVYIVVVLVAASLRVVVLPALVRAREAGRLGEELAAYAVVLAAAALPLLLVALAAPETAAGLLTSTPVAEENAAEALRWLVPAGLAQVAAGLAASALAATDEYLVAAAGFAAGACAGVVVIVLRLDAGLRSLSEGLVANGAVSLAVPLLVLLARRLLRARPGGPLRAGPRLLELARGAGLTLAVQGLLLIALHSAGTFGVGQQTSFSYAYLIASSVVAVTAVSFSLVTVAPLTRLGVTPELAARHVGSLVWLSLLPIAASAALFAVVGEPLLGATLGEAFAGDAGREIGYLVLALGPWMVAYAAVAIVLPLLFVAGRARALPALAAATVLVHLPVDLLGRELGGLTGVALALAATTAAVALALLALLSPATLRAVVRALARPRLPEAWAYARTLR
jgi:hypothetical protein